MDEQQISEIIRFLETVKDRYSKSKKILDNVEGLEVRYQKAIVATDKIVSETGEARSEVQAFQSQAKIAVEQIQETRSGISGYLEAAKGTIERLQELSNDAAALKGLLEGGKGEFDALLQNARNLTEEITKLKKSAEDNLAKSEQMLADFQAKAQQMSDTFNEFAEIKKKIDDEDTGLAAALRLVQQAQVDSEKIVLEIQQLLKSSQATEKEISDIKNKSTSALKDIEISLKTVNEKRSQVEEVSGLVIDGSFAHTFEKRKKEISKSLDSDLFSWKYIMLLSVASLILMELGLGEVSGLNGFLTRLAYTSPLVFLTLFSAIQYSKERQFLEKYAFKAASAAAVRNHIEFLIEKFKSDEKVKEFSLATFSSIYSEPFKVDSDKKTDNEKKDKDVLGGVGIKNMIEIVDKLYELIPDEAIVKQAVDAVATKRNKSD